MIESPESAYWLMLIGMIAVFTVLFIVVYGGRILITVVNKFSLSEPENFRAPLNSLVSSHTNIPDSAINKAIESAVTEWSGGKLSVKEIQKL